MKNILLLCLSAALASCGGQTTEKKAPLYDTTNSSTASQNVPATANSPANTQFIWTGTINKKIPILLHYTRYTNFVAGEVVYLNTKDRKPIRVLGRIDEDSSYRIQEFQPDGSITGIFQGRPGKSLTWFAPNPKGIKELPVELTAKDTAITPMDIRADLNDIYGNYVYSYKNIGAAGGFDFTRIGADKASFAINTVTSGPAFNVADVPMDTISFSNSDHFEYTIPESDSCSFKVSFYKGFAIIDYTNGYCNGQFGNNATIDAIFLKVKK